MTEPQPIRPNVRVITGADEPETREALQAKIDALALKDRAEWQAGMADVALQSDRVASGDPDPRIRALAKQSWEFLVRQKNNAEGLS